MKFKKYLLYGLAILCIFTALPLSSVQALTIEQLSTDSNRIDVYFHDDGEDLSSLTKDDITATLDGNALTVDDFQQSAQRINYMFLLDISRSVPEEYMTAAKQEILKIYENLNEEDLLSVITFGSEVHTILDGTETLEEARTILDGVHCTNDYTHFYDAVNLMLERLEGTSEMRNIAVVVSDGINTGDVNTSVDSLKSKLSGSGIAIYALAVDSAEPDDIDSFREFIQLSGGELFPFSPETCAASMQQLQQSVDAIWKVGIQVDPTAATGESQSLVVRIGDYGTIEREVVIEQRILDTTAPTITDWAIDTEKDTLSLFFSEAMADLSDPSHYQITGPDNSLVPVTVLEHGEVYVLLSIEGFENVPGWRADFVRLMDASPNRNLLEEKTLLLTAEIVETPETPETPEEPGDKDLLSLIPADLLKYLPIAVGILALLLILIICLIVKTVRDHKAAKLHSPEWAEANGNPNQENASGDSSGCEEGEGSIVRDNGSATNSNLNKKESDYSYKEDDYADEEDTDKKRGFFWSLFGIGISREKKEKKTKQETNKVNAPKTKRVWFRWLGRNVVEESEVSDEYYNSEGTGMDDASGRRVAMSKGSAMPMSAAPVRGASQGSSGSSSADSSADASDEDEGTHVNAPKRRRGLFGFFGLFKSNNHNYDSLEELEEESRVKVNDPLRGIHAPTTQGESAESAEEVEVDKVSEHRRNPKVRRKVRRNWFFWKKKEIPVAEEKPEEENPSAETDAAEASEADEISEAAARKYVKPKRRWFWQKKKKEVPTEEPSPEEEAPAEEESDVEEDQIDEKTAHKYIKPKKNWFKKNVIPVAKQAIPERPLENEGTDGDQTAKSQTDVAESAGTTPKAAEQPVPEKKADDGKPAAKQEPKHNFDGNETSIKSGGFSISGISTDYRPSIFNFSLRQETKLKDVTYKKSNKTTKKAKSNQAVKTEKTKKTYTSPSLSSPSRSKTYSSSKSKKVNFTFKGDNKKKK